MKTASEIDPDADPDLLIAHAEAKGREDIIVHIVAALDQIESAGFTTVSIKAVKGMLRKAFRDE